MTRHSQAGRLRDFAALLAASREGEPALDLHLEEEPLMVELEEHHAQALSLIGRREALLASARELTVQLKETVAVGYERTVALRSLIRSKLGPCSEKLARYGIKPLPRRRSGGVKVPAGCRKAG